jgi:hypothetical protein
MVAVMNFERATTWSNKLATRLFLVWATVLSARTTLRGLTHFRHLGQQDAQDLHERVGPVTQDLLGDEEPDHPINRGSVSNLRSHAACG